MKFGEFIKTRRIQLGFTLRRFCREAGYDPSNISRLERGLLPPPKSPIRIAKYAKALQLKEGSAEWDGFFDLAAIGSGTIPPRLLSDDEMVDKLPVVFNAIRPGSVDRLVEMIRRA